MPEITAQSKVFRDWEGLLGACTQNAPLLQGMDSLKAELELRLAEARDLKIQQENFAGNKLATTQRLGATIELGREAARKLRAYVLIHLGSDSRHLTQFGVSPRQKNPRKAKRSAAAATTATLESPKPPSPSGE
jgi:integrase